MKELSLTKAFALRKKVQKELDERLNTLSTVQVYQLDDEAIKDALSRKFNGLSFEEYSKNYADDLEVLVRFKSAIETTNAATRGVFIEMAAKQALLVKYQEVENNFKYNRGVSEDNVKDGDKWVKVVTPLKVSVDMDILTASIKQLKSRIMELEDNAGSMNAQLKVIITDEDYAKLLDIAS